METKAEKIAVLSNIILHKAERIKELEAENKKLREALEKIVSYRKWLKMSGGMDIHKIAEQTLKG